MDLHICNKLIVFGGTFDPPHMAHVALPRAVMKKLGADAVAYVPAARAPLKPGSEPSPIEHRFAMLHLALRDCSYAQVLTVEIDRADADRPSFTVDTLEKLRKELGCGVEMRLLIGSDQMHQFDRWKAPQKITQLAEPLVLVRPPSTRKSCLAPLGRPALRRAWADRLVEVEPMDVSSSQIRNLVARGESISGLVPPPGETYIFRHKLYRDIKKQQQKVDGGKTQ